MNTLLNTLIRKQDFSTQEAIDLVRYLRTQMVPMTGLIGAIDTCGTGGDYAQTLNASTMSAFVCAAAGVKVAKHGNRASTSKCGSFDLLEALGINIDLTHDQIRQCFNETGLAFLYAPAFHPAFKEIAPIRKSLGIRTIFNYIGPLLNPALVKRQLIGVSDSRVIPILGSVLMELGSERVVIIHGFGGIDEASVAGATAVYVFEQDKEPQVFQVMPRQLFSIDSVQGGDAQENAKRTKQILQGKGTPAEAMFMALNSGLALYAAGHVEKVEQGIELAETILKNGAAYEVLQKVITITNKHI